MKTSFFNVAAYEFSIILTTQLLSSHCQDKMFDTQN